MTLILFSENIVCILCIKRIKPFCLTQPVTAAIHEKYQNETDYK